MRHIFYKQQSRLTGEEKWHLERYLDMSKELRVAYELKEKYKEWFEISKRMGKEKIVEVKNGLKAFYQEVEAAGIKELMKAIGTFRNWQTEILNSFIYGYSNGFLEGINNTSKVIKRNAYGFRSFKRFRAKILLNRQYKRIGSHIG